MLNSRERFTATADHYHLHRPSYPSTLVEWIVTEAGLEPPACVADIGCGTGIAARLFVARGFEVVGVDPNPQMLAYARATGLACAPGEASRTGLAAASVDLVIAAQAFHWFDVPEALAEFRRICRPPGRCAAFWNVREGGALMQEYDRLLTEWSEEYRKVPKPDAAIAALRTAPGVFRLREQDFPNRQPLDRDGFFGRVWSSSYVAHGISDHDAFDRALGALFERHQRDGRVEFQYRTVALLWQLEPPAPPR